jgi:hypothetical protein
MAKQLIDIGSTANDQTADTIRSAFDKVNDNFSEIYTALGTDSPSAPLLKFVADDSTGVALNLNETFRLAGGAGITTEISGDTLTITAQATGEPITFVGDDSTGTGVNSGETFKIAGTQNITTAVSGDVLTITGPDLTPYLTNSTFTVVGDDSTGTQFNTGETVKIAGGTGITTAMSSDVLTVTNSGAITAFTTIQVADNTDVSASTASDTLTFVGGDNMVIQTSGNTITFHASGNVGAEDSSSFDDVITGTEGRLAYYVENGNTLAETGSSVDYNSITGALTAQTFITNTISSVDSTAVQINDNLNVDGSVDVGSQLTISNGTAVTAILDEDTLSSNSDSALATQQSIKAYVDTQIGAVSTTLGISDSSSNTGSVATGTNDLEFRSGNSVTATVSGTGVTFDINDSITVDDITAKDSTAVNINSPIQVTGNINTDTSLTVTGTTITQILDEDNMVSNSATALATQQSIKAYIDANSGGVLTMGDSASNSGSVASGSGQDLEFRSGDGITLTVSGNGVTATLNKIIDVNEISSSDSTAVQINEGLNVSGALFVNGAVSTNSTISTATGSTVGTLTLADGSITDSSGTISFDNENLTTTGTVTGSTVITNTVQSSDSTVVNINDGLKVEGGLNVQGGAEIYGTLYAQAVGAEDSTQLTFVSDIQINGTSSTINDLTITTNNLNTVTISTQGNEDLVLNADTDNIRVEANLTQFTSNVQIDGNLTVNGTETIVNTTNLQIEDNQIVLARNNSADAVDIGFFGHTYPAGFDSTVPNHVGLFRDATNSEWYLIATYSKNEDQTTIDRADPSFGLATLNTLNINTGDVTATGSFIIGSADLNETDITKIDGITNGTASANKAVVLDGSSNITGINDVTITGSFIIGSASMNETDLEKLDGITNGTGTANKALVLDGSSNISTGGNITSNGITAGNIRVGITGDNEIDTASGNLTIDSAGGTVTVDDNLIVSGNLTVNGTSTTVNATNTTIEDPLIVLNRNAGSIGDRDIGLVLDRGINTNVAMLWDESADEFAFVNTSEDGETTGNVTISSYANLQVNTLTGTATEAQYADLAEMYSADAEYEPGTVMIFGGDAEITQSTVSHDSRTAGVVSTAPAYLMNSKLANGTAIALQGRVPCRVQGVIKKGDLVTTSNTPGVACKMNKDQYEIGCVIGKAIQDHTDSGQGIIEVVVGRL